MSSLRAGKPGQQPERGQDAAAPIEQASGVTLGPRDRLIGQLYIEGDLHVNGTLEGEVEATGDVDVAEAATVNASVAGREVNISGHMNGAVTASKKLVVSRGGSLVGDVVVPRLVIQDGASFNGNVSMNPGGQPPPRPAAVSETPAALTPEPAPPAPPAAPAAQVPTPDRSKPKRR